MATGLIETSSLTHELIIFCQKVDVFSDGQICDISNLSPTYVDSNKRLQHHCLMKHKSKIQSVYF